MITPEKHRQLKIKLDKLNIQDSDFEERFILSSGKGGQAQNKRSSSVDLFHPSSGIRVKMQKYRSQELNRYYAKKNFCELYESQVLGVKTKKEMILDKKIKQKKRRKRRSKRKLDLSD